MRRIETKLSAYAAHSTWMVFLKEDRIFDPLLPEMAKMVRRSRKTVYGWIATGEIGEADGVFVVQGRLAATRVCPVWETQFAPKVCRL